MAANRREPDSPAAPGDRIVQDVMALARTARDRGHAALTNGKILEATRWLDRALRLAPRDLNLALSLASAVLAREPARAASLFRRVANEADVREAWQGLAAAHLLLGAPQEAARCLAHALSRAVIAPGLAGLADEVARRSGAQGWCGVGRDDKLRPGKRIQGADGADLIIRPTRPGEIEILLDGQPLRGSRLPRDWRGADQIEVLCDRSHLMGSPIDAARLRRVVGYAEEAEGAIRGWAWLPADPDADPVLQARAASGEAAFRLTARNEQIVIEDAGPLARPRGFLIPAERLALHPGAWHILGPNGRDLLGSPLDPTFERRARAAAVQALAQLPDMRTVSDADAPGTEAEPGRPRSLGGPPRPAAPGTGRAVTTKAGSEATDGSDCGRTPMPPAPTLRNQQPAWQPSWHDLAQQAVRWVPMPIAAPPALGVAQIRRRAADIVIPVHDNGPVVLACLDSVLRTVPRGSRVIVVDDASEAPELTAALERLASRRRIVLIRNPRNLGFPASANAGIAAARDRDVVLLNSDTLVPPNWLERLRGAIYQAPDAGTITPLSNAATILNYPDREGGNPAPDQDGTDRLSELAWRANGDRTVEIPVGVGFCLYIRRDCLDAVGLLRADVFAQGYGEENDFCLRARALGWRHLAAPGVFVTHRGGASFGGPGRHLQRRNERILERLHPGYADLVSAFIQADPLAEARRKLDLARWNAARGRTESVLLITHADGGGVEQRVQEACASHREAGRRPLILRPARAFGPHRLARLEDEARGTFPNLLFRIPGEQSALLRLLRAARVTAVEVHHLLDHDPAVQDLVEQLGAAYDVHIHDYAWFCPRIALVGADRRYCGEPPPSGCEDCIADAGRLISEDIPVASLIERSSRFLASAAQVIAPSQDAATRMRRHFPQLRPKMVPHEDDGGIPSPAPIPVTTRTRICVAGAIGLHKGYDVLLACARDASARALNLEFVVVGTTIDDARLMATDRVFVTGSYERAEAVSLIQAQQASYGLLPSIWPETWCLGLTELWKAGLDVAAFDVGAPSERIRRMGRGLILPLGLPAAKINDALVAALSPTRDR